MFLAFSGQIVLHYAVLEIQCKVIGSIRFENNAPDTEADQ